jgi:uncharacterized protein (TIGR00251 family)
MLAITEHAGRIVVKIRVQAGSSANKIVGEFNGALKLKIAAAPERGKANREIAVFLARRLGLSRSDVRLIHGEKARDKQIEIKGVSKAELLERLGIKT